MKKQLLTVLLALTTASCFAVAKPTSTELLAHLKNVKVELLDNIKDMTESMSTFEINLLDEFYNASKILQKYVSHNIDNDFKLICNMTTWDEVLYSPIQKPMSFINANIKNLSHVFESIYTKLHQNYCTNNPQGEFVNVTAQDMFKDACNAIIYSDGLIMSKKLLKKIDAKITKLEKQI